MPINITTNGLIERTGTGAGGARTIGVGSGTSIPTRDEVASAYALQVGQVSGGEITAGTETALRTYAPADIKAFVDQHASSVIPEILLPVPAYGESGNEPVTAVVGGVPVQDFADGDTVLWPFTVPEGFEDSAPVLELVCAWDATASGNFNLSAAIEAKGAGATLTTASYDTTNTQGTSGSRTANVMLVVSITLTNRDSWTAGDAARCKLTLDTDTMGSGGLRLVSARIVPGA